MNILPWVLLQPRVVHVEAEPVQVRRDGHRRGLLPVHTDGECFDAS